MRRSVEVFAASDGTLEILIAGRPDVLRRAGAWLKHVGSRTTVVAGGIGAAQAAKTVTQVMQTLEMLALVESMELARTYGLSEQDALRVLSRLLSQAWAIDRWDDVKQALTEMRAASPSVSFARICRCRRRFAEGVPLPLTAAGSTISLARVHPIAEVDESGGCRVT